jgi:glycosyltransferase involved in cell wall biosynthesis
MVIMKILIAADLHWPTINGVATFSRNLAQGLAARGHEVVVIAPSQTGGKYKEIDENYTIIRTRALPFPFYQNFRISMMPQAEVRAIIKKFKPDVIHIQMLMGNGRAAMIYGKKFGIPVVATNHAMPENLLDNLRLLAPFAKPIGHMIKEYGARFHNNADYVTLPTQAAIDLFDGNTDGMRVPIKAISNGIDLSKFKPGKVPAGLLEKYKIPKGVPVVTYLGRLDSEKHVSTLVRAFAEVVAHTKAHLLIVGSGNDYENLGETVKELGIADRVTLTGRIPEEDKPGLHRIGKVFVTPSPVELQCIAMLEAMASGLPVIGVNDGALYELAQDGKNGYIVETDDVEAMADRITRLLSDEQLREKMAKESLKIAKTHDMEYTLDEFEKIYKKVIADKKRQ